MRLIRFLAGIMAMAWLLVMLTAASAQQPDSRALFGLDETRGLRVKTDAAQSGYVLFSPLLSDTLYLVDIDGQVVQTWRSDLAPSGFVYLLDDASVLRGGREPNSPVFNAGGQGGRIQQIGWDGELLWDFTFSDERHLLHHDVEVLPSGNVLAISWELVTAEEALQAGRRPELIPNDGLWLEKILEFERQPPDAANIVWEWRALDHTIQNVAPDLDHYGDPADNPERIDINAEPSRWPGRRPANDADASIDPDILHMNAIDYNPALDQILLSTQNLSEIWIIDHSTSTQEASGHVGGRWGRGGDLLYRWGNDNNYGHAEVAQSLGRQHDSRWIPEGFPGSGNILVFNNNEFLPDGVRTAVYEIVPPIDNDGYILNDESRFGPDAPVWTYSAPDSFQASFLSGAHRLANGNTFITSGPRGRFFEVSVAGEVVWEYWSPYSGEVVMPGGDRPQPVGPAVYSVFRATKISPNHPALAGRELLPLDPQPEIVPPIFPE